MLPRSYVACSLTPLFFEHEAYFAYWLPARDISLATRFAAMATMPAPGSARDDDFIERLISRGHVYRERLSIFRAMSPAYIASPPRYSRYRHRLRLRFTALYAMSLYLL
jgi:hypothetical protein